jgi:hypothetical protein
MTIVACGFDGFNLTYFGQGSVQPTACPPPWLWRTFAITSSAGLLVTISAGAVAMAFQRRAGLTPLMRLLLALLATHFLVGQLWYATAGGYHAVMDPAAIAVMLDVWGLHVLAWLPPLVLYAVAALYGARAIVDAFRVYFGSRTRLHTLKQITATLGVAELLYFAAFRTEAAFRTDIGPTITIAAEHRAATLVENPWNRIHQFQIRYVLVAIAVTAFALALARPVVPGDGAEDAALRPVPRRYAAGVALAALGCAVTITVLVRI